MPVIIVAVSAAIRSGGYGTDRVCWISTEKGLIWAFAGPVLGVIAVSADDYL